MDDDDEAICEGSVVCDDDPSFSAPARFSNNDGAFTILEYRGN